MSSLNYSYPVRLMLSGPVTENGVKSGGFIPVTVATNTRIGTSNPNYRIQIAKRQNASSAYSKTENKVVPATVYAETKSRANSTSPWIYQSGIQVSEAAFSHPTSIPSRPITDDIALKRLKGKLARDLEQFKALIPLGEIKETRGLLRHTLDSSVDLMKSLIEIKRSGGRKVLSKASDAWLNFSFGISPTVSDFNSAINSIGKYMSKEFNTIVHRGTAFEEWHVPIPKNISGFISTANIKTSPGSSVHTYQVMYTAGINVDLRSANNYGISEHFGLTFGDLPSLLWELTPFSWVVDYFSTTGAFLEDLFFSPPGNTLYITKSVKYHLKQEAVNSLDFSGNANKVLILRTPPSTMTNSVFMFNRSLLTNLPHRTLRFKNADEIGINSVKKLLNLSSILLK